MEELIKICASRVRQPQFQLEGINGLTINRGEQIAIVGGNGSGKSILVGILTGAHPLIEGDGVRYGFGEGRVSDKIRYIAFRDSTAASGATDSGYFYQQRWNSTTLEESPRVREELPESPDERILGALGVGDLLDKRLVLLSSGEMRKFQITKALLSAPQLLIMDNPFIGLDVASRAMLNRLMEDMTQKMGLQIIVVLSREDDIPPFMTHIVEMEGRRVVAKRSMAEYMSTRPTPPSSVLPTSIRERIEQLPTGDIPTSEMVAELNGVTIKYGDRTILSTLDWQVRRGERWALSGENGAGKSTLLSLICADNPQAYACDISLFGRQRGSGESIWDIKRNIGYVSPEMHRSYNLAVPSIEIVASGLHDTIGLNRRMQEEHVGVSRMWMEIFGIEGVADRLFTQLSSGEQRLVLLARAFVKDPALLILDEPLHGLDTLNRRRVVEIIEAVSRRAGKSLIVVTHYPEELPSTITHRLYLKRNA